MGEVVSIEISTVPAKSPENFPPELPEVKRPK